MKKVKLVFVTLALIALCSSFITSSSSAGLFRKYRIVCCDGFRVYVEDITNLINGADYLCDAYVSTTCTFGSLLPPLYDPWSGCYYFDTSILWLGINVEEGEFYDLRY